MGRVIDLHKSKSKIRIIEKEFRNAEEKMAKRMKEEEALRGRVKIQRRREFEQCKKVERIAKMKLDRERQRQLLRSMTPKMLKNITYPKP